MAKQLSRWQTFKWPIALFILSMTGIITALVGEGIVDLIASLALGSTLVVTAAYIKKNK